MHPVAILNTSIVTENGTYTFQPITSDDAIALVHHSDILSAVGHESTAEVLSNILRIEIPVNRIAFSQQKGQTALVFKLNGRLPEGRVLSRSDIDEIGYSLNLLTRIA